MAEDNALQAMDKGAAQFARDRVEALKAEGKIRVDEEQKIFGIMMAYHNKYREALSKDGKEREALIIKAETAAVTFCDNFRKQSMYNLSAAEKKAKLESVISQENADKKRREAAHRAEMDELRAKHALGLVTAKELADKKREFLRQEKGHANDMARAQRELRDASRAEAADRSKAAKDEVEARKASRKQLESGAGMKAAQENFGNGNFKNGVAALLKGATDATDIKGKVRQNAEDKRAKADASAAKVEELQEIYQKAKDEGASEEELAAILKEGQEAQLEATKDANAAAAAEMANAVADAIGGAYRQAVNKAETILNDYQGVIDARMQGSDKNFKEMSNMISNNLSVSPFVKTTKVLDQLKEATEKGINYNIEQRAFLSSISDKIASTFDAFDSNLLRIIRLQQADTTATRMGMEASLTKLFNNMFQDTSYLSDIADSISGAIVDANSQLSYQASAEFEFVVQKWLGALGSLGMSSDSLTQIATGLNYLATGDVTNLANNTSLQTMFAMAASNANMEYSELLLNGLDASSTNKLLESMVLYLKDIAENSDNQVVKAAYGDIFNMSLSDMKAISNLTTDEISTLSGTSMSYGDMESEINNQMNQLWTRTSLATMLTNVYDNVMYSVASDMVNNPVTFAMQKMLDFMEETKTDINIPFINAMGFGLDVNASVKDLMQMGLGIGQAMSLTGSILGGLASGGGTDLDSWGATETTKRGSGLNLGSASTYGGVSGSIGTFATSGSSKDISNSTMSSATDDAEESKKITNKNSKPPDTTLDDLVKLIVGESSESFVVANDPVLNNSYDDGSNAIRVLIGGMTFEDGVLKVVDHMLIATVAAGLSEIQTLVSAFSLGFLGAPSESGNNAGSNTGGVMDNFMKQVVGDSAESYIVVKDKFFDSVFNSVDTALKVTDARMIFSDSNLQVVDTSLNKTVSDELPAIKTLITSMESKGNTVKLEEGAVVNIDKKTITEAFNDALYSDKDYSVGSAVKYMKNGEISVQKVSEAVAVKNNLGEKLQVSNLVW